MGPRREAKNQQARVGISKTGHGFGPVVPVKVSAAFDLAHFAAMRNQSRAERARNDFFIERTKIGSRGNECCALAGTARHLLKVYQRLVYQSKKLRRGDD